MFLAQGLLSTGAFVLHSNLPHDQNSLKLLACLNSYFHTLHDRGILFMLTKYILEPELFVHGHNYVDILFIFVILFANYTML